MYPILSLTPEDGLSIGNGTMMALLCERFELLPENRTVTEATI